MDPLSSMTKSECFEVQQSLAAQLGQLVKQCVAAKEGGDLDKAWDILEEAQRVREEISKLDTVVKLKD